MPLYRFFHNFIYSFSAVLDLRAWVGSLLLCGLCSSCGELGLLSSCGVWASQVVVASLVVGHGSRARGLRQLLYVGLVVATLRL